MLIRIDQWLITKFEKFAHWFQRMSGLDCFWLARQCHIVRMLSAGIILVTGISGSSIVIVTLWAVLVAVAIHDIARVAKIKRRAIKNMESGCANPLKHEDTITRLINTTLIALGLVVLILEISLRISTVFGLLYCTWAVSHSFGEYFQACDPLPPCKSRVREWLRSIGKARIQKPVEV